MAACVPRWLRARNDNHAQRNNRQQHNRRRDHHVHDVLKSARVAAVTERKHRYPMAEIHSMTANR